MKKKRDIKRNEIRLKIIQLDHMNRNFRELVVFHVLSTRYVARFNKICYPYTVSIIRIFSTRIFY